MRHPLSIMLVTAGFLLAATQAHAFGVVGSGSPGSCTEAALDGALVGGGAVSFDCGGGPVTIALTGTKVISSPTDIDGGGLITLDAGGLPTNIRHFTLAAGDLALSNITLVNGRPNNAADDGGAVYVDAASSLTVTNATFRDNGASSGAAIWSLGTLQVSGSTFTGNTGQLSGVGTVGAGGGSAEIVNSTFTGNSVVHGGAIGATGGASMTVTHGTLVGSINANDAVFSGGTGTSITLRNSIAMKEGSGPVCDLYDNGVIVDGGGNLQYGGNTPDSCGAGIPTADPLLGALADNGGPTWTRALGAGSPAIDAADGANGQATDQRGIARPNGAGYDVGAYEYYPQASPAPTLSSWAMLILVLLLLLTGRGRAGERQSTRPLVG